ncbi:MAG: DUF262 domain-containing protein [Candidatus Electrothrix sp. AW3_4]|nr:DUF262 domain-containing protein [Candidatus Electrothrix gigas]
MSNQQSLNQFFTRKILHIPKYQRSYAWGKQNVRELYEDIQEAYETNSTHYIGTIVLARTDSKDVYHIVDGQQRITTIIMFINAIIETLEDAQDKDYYTRFYIKSKKQYKLKPLERDIEFFNRILEGDKTEEPHSKSQRYLLDAYIEIENIINQLIEKPIEFLRVIEDLYVLEFIEDNESDAIRIFQTVNDRGKELSRMDKMKSLLFYFSNKYLSQKYDEKINNTFGEIFELYDDIKLIGENQSINIISSKQFNEDDLLRQHHICFSEESYDPTVQQVMDSVKIALLDLRKSGNTARLDEYIITFIGSLLEYVRAFKNVISKTTANERYYKIFSILGLSAVYYPVITQLKKCGFLETELPSKKISVLEMIEIIDVRVFKIRDYAGKKHVAAFAYSLANKNWTLDEIEEHLIWFNSFEISNERFKDYLTNYDYYKQTGLLRLLFIDYCERLSKKEYSLNELQEIMRNNPTIEHILSQTPKFKPHSFGFKNNEEFEEFKNLIGNLILLEKKINSSIKNIDLSEKVKGYSKSKFKITEQFATWLSQTKSFKKKDLKKRSTSLVEDFSKRWWA